MQPPVPWPGVGTPPGLAHDEGSAARLAVALTWGCRIPPPASSSHRFTVLPRPPPEGTDRVVPGCHLASHAATTEATFWGNVKGLFSV